MSDEGVKRITISIPLALSKRVDRLRPHINVSVICAEALARFCDERIAADMKVILDKTYPFAKGGTVKQPSDTVPVWIEPNTTFVPIKTFEKWSEPPTIEAPTNLTGEMFIAQLRIARGRIDAAMGVDRGVSKIRTGWTPTDEQRKAASEAGFTLYGPGEEIPS